MILSATSRQSSEVWRSAVPKSSPPCISPSETVLMSRQGTPLRLQVSTTAAASISQMSAPQRSCRARLASPPSTNLSAEAQTTFFSSGAISAARSTRAGVAGRYTSGYSKYCPGRVSS